MSGVMEVLSPILGAVSPISSLLGIGKQEAPSINIPEPKRPAPPAPTARYDSGASILLGSNSSNNRVSGRVHKPATTRSGDVLGGLGRSGLNI
jgi:hypothetical protein